MALECILKVCVLLNLADGSKLGYIMSTIVMGSVYINIPQCQGKDDD
jgi:hypothetical protein